MNMKNILAISLTILSVSADLHDPKTESDDQELREVLKILELEFEDLNNLEAFSPDFRNLFWIQLFKALYDQALDPISHEFDDKQIIPSFDNFKNFVVDLIQKEPEVDVFDLSFNGYPKKHDFRMANSFPNQFLKPETIKRPPLDNLRSLDKMEQDPQELQTYYMRTLDTKTNYLDQLEYIFEKETGQESKFDDANQKIDQFQQSTTFEFPSQSRPAYAHQSSFPVSAGMDFIEPPVSSNKINLRSSPKKLEKVPLQKEDQLMMDEIRQGLLSMQTELFQNEIKGKTELEIQESELERLQAEQELNELINEIEEELEIEEAEKQTEEQNEILPIGEVMTKLETQELDKKKLNQKESQNQEEKQQLYPQPIQQINQQQEFMPNKELNESIIAPQLSFQQKYYWYEIGGFGIAVALALFYTLAIKKNNENEED